MSTGLLDRTGAVDVDGQGRVLVAGVKGGFPAVARFTSAGTPGHDVLRRRGGNVRLSGAALGRPTPCRSGWGAVQRVGAGRRGERLSVPRWRGSPRRSSSTPPTARAATTATSATGARRHSLRARRLGRRPEHVDLAGRIHHDDRGGGSAAFVWRADPAGVAGGARAGVPSRNARRAGQLHRPVGARRRLGRQPGRRSVCRDLHRLRQRHGCPPGPDDGDARRRCCR